MKDEIEKGRKFLKAADYEELEEKFGDLETDQQSGIAPPPLQKPYPQDAALIDLIVPDNFSFDNTSLAQAIGNRKSHRNFSDAALSLEELSFLLWATQGVREIDPKKIWTKRTVPSGGARQPFETYIIVNRVDGLEPGVYRYLAIEHKLLHVSDAGDNQVEKIKLACHGQGFCAKSAVVFVWATIPYWTEWRYSIMSHKDIAIEAGHVCQNLYLACEGIGAGTCGIAAYDQKLIDSLIKVDGKDEFTVYLSPVGKVD